MKSRNNSKGGKHVAGERGSRPTDSGWPFQRELREFALICPDLRQRPTAQAIALVKEHKPCAA
jgi:hypothetical protein